MPQPLNMSGPMSEARHAARALGRRRCRSTARARRSRSRSRRAACRRRARPHRCRRRRARRPPRIVPGGASAAASSRSARSVSPRRRARRAMPRRAGRRSPGPRPARWALGQRAVAHRVSRRPESFQPWLMRPFARPAQVLHEAVAVRVTEPSIHPSAASAAGHSRSTSSCPPVQRSYSASSTRNSGVAVDGAVVGRMRDLVWRAPSPRCAARGGSCRAPHRASHRSWSCLEPREDGQRVAAPSGAGCSGAAAT